MHLVFRVRLGPCGLGAEGCEGMSVNRRVLCVRALLCTLAVLVATLLVIALRADFGIWLAMKADHPSLLATVVEFHGESSMPVLARWLRSNDLIERDLAVIGLRHVGSPGAVVPLFIEALDDPSPHVQADAAESLAILGPIALPALPRLRSRLTDLDSSRRLQAIQAIGSMGPSARVCAASLEKMAKADASAEVRELAAWAVGELSR
jgi:HEAT repeat protein